MNDDAVTPVAALRALLPHASLAQGLDPAINFGGLIDGLCKTLSSRIPVEICQRYQARFIKKLTAHPDGSISMLFLAAAAAIALDTCWVVDLYAISAPTSAVLTMA